jgi:rhamnulokinase
MARSLHLAVDLGAGSGRAFLGEVSPDGLALSEVHRFHYEPRPLAGHLRWDAARLQAGLREGVRLGAAAAAAGGGRLATLGVDSWAVDYALLDAGGRLLEEPICYRDARTQGVIEEAMRRVPEEEVFRRTGIQRAPFNTLYQLLAHVREGLPPAAALLLFIPDLCHHWLCGSRRGERTNASTTQLLAAGGGWDQDLFDRLSLPRHLMPELVAAGTRLGRLAPEWSAEAGLEGAEVVAPATHDTASAVVGTPLEPGWAFLSSGTWSLLGLERLEPLLGEAAFRANVTNEAGAFGTVRLLKNVMGLWLLESCRKEWEATGRGQPLPPLLEAVGQVQGFPGFVFPDDPRFFSPPSMERELRAALAGSGQEASEDPVRLAKVILDSLALRYASVVEILERLTGQTVAGLHIVGGGSLNDYLNQATADATGLPVRAGPAEATACGNLLVQAIAHGTLASLEDGRRLLARTEPPRVFHPRAGSGWREARERYRALEVGGAASG